MLGLSLLQLQSIIDARPGHALHLGLPINQSIFSQQVPIRLFVINILGGTSSS